MIRGRWLRAPVVCGVLVALVAIFLQTARGQMLDSLSFGAFSAFGGYASTVNRVAGTARTLVPALVGVVDVLVAVVIVWRERSAAWPRIAAAVAVPVVSVTVCELLKRLLTRPDHGFYDGIPGNSFPSGHSALAGGVVVALWLMLPPALRRPWLAAVLTLLAALTAYSSYLAFAHRPSDTVGGLLVAALVALPFSRGEVFHVVVPLGLLTVLMVLLADHHWTPARGVIWPGAGDLAAAATLFPVELRRPRPPRPRVPSPRCGSAREHSLVPPGRGSRPRQD